MKIKDYKCKCGHNDFFFADKGNQKGIYCSYCGKWVKWADKDEQNLTMKQEPCEDAVSRQAVLSMQYRINDSATLSTRDVVNVEDIEDLPSVTPKEKTGYWIDKEVRGKIEPYCSVCGDSVDTMYHYDYCPNCGAKMEESEEV